MRIPVKSYFYSQTFGLEILFYFDISILNSFAIPFSLYFILFINREIYDFREDFDNFLLFQKRLIKQIFDF